MAPTLQVDLVIFGGGIAGLWVLDQVRRAGYSAVLCESGRLGAGQTVASQGIIHGGLKYTLDGLLNPAARAIRDMPDLWRACHAGTRAPDLRGAHLRSAGCHLWRTNSIRSQIGMLGARVGLAVRPQSLPRAEWPSALAGLKGEVFALPEPVFDPGDILEKLRTPHAEYVLAAELSGAFEPRCDAQSATFEISAGARRMQVSTRRVVLCAGAGNTQLLRRFGGGQITTQLRPLHMAMVRGDLPALNGHCTDAAATRVTITTAQDAAGRTVWQIGGQVAEVGVEMDRASLIAHARSELQATVPGVNLTRAEWSAYRVDRAEPRTAGGRRPDDAVLHAHGSVLAAWPSKLALAPRLAEQVAALLPPPATDAATVSSALTDWPRPQAALPPWETEPEWIAGR